MFNKQNKAQKQQIKDQIKNLEEQLEVLLAVYNQSLETYKESISDKWEYLQSARLNQEQLNELGRRGWELVSAATYQETTQRASFYNDGRVDSTFIMYVFKRKLYPIPNDVISEINARFSNIPRLKDKIKSLRDDLEFPPPE